MFTDIRNRTADCDGLGRDAGEQHSAPGSLRADAGTVGRR